MTRRITLTLALGPLAAALAGAQIKTIEPVQPKIAPPAQLQVAVPINARAKLLAATGPSRPGTGPEVRIRWIVSEGWIPDGGFRLYRIQGGQRTKVFPKDGPKTKADSINLAQAAAIQPLAVTAKVAIAGDTKLFPGLAPAPKSGLELFNARLAKSRELLPKPDVSGRRLVRELNTLPAVQTFLGGLVQPAPGPVTFSTADALRRKTLDARRSLLFTAFARSDISEEIGFGASDFGLAKGTEVGYQLFEVDATGKEGSAPIGSIASFEVGADPAPPAPGNLLACQAGEGLVELRWDRLTPQQEQPLGVALYSVRRVTAKEPSGVLLTKDPITIADIPTSSGLVEPIAFFADRDAPPGPVTYQVRLIDGFGRSSEASTVQIDVADLRTPPAPAPVRATLAGGAQNQPPVKVFWKGPSDAQVQYNVYRIDTEEGKTPVKLTPTPIGGEPVITKTSAEAIALFQQQTGASAASLNLRDQAAMSKITERLKGTRTFVDTSAARDKKYRYVVRAVYAFNTGRESSDGSSAILEVPTLEAPPAPLNLRVASFQAQQTAPSSLSAYQPRTGGFLTSGPTVGSPIGSTPIGSTPIGATPIANLGKLPLGALKPLEEKGGSFKLTWNAVPGHKGVVYRVYRATKEQPQFLTELGQTTATSFTDSLPRSYKIEYVYFVKPQSRWGIAGTMTPAAQAVAPATLAPSSPVILALTPSADGAGISMKLSVPDPAEDVVTYKVYRKNIVNTPISILRSRIRVTSPKAGAVSSRPHPAEDDQGYQQVGEVQVPDGTPPPQLAFSDASANDPKVKYYYKVQAVNRVNLKSERSQPLGCEPLRVGLPAPTNVAATSLAEGIRVTWTAVPGATGYIVSRATATGQFTPVSGTIAAANFVDKTALRGRPYRYAVVAVDQLGNVSTRGETQQTAAVPRG